MGSPSTQRRVTAADDDERLLIDLGQHVRTRRRNVLPALDHDPVAPEPLATLEVEETLAVIRPTGQQRGAPKRSPDAGDLVGGEETGGGGGGHDLGMSFFASRNGIAAVVAAQRSPSDDMISSGVPGEDSSSGSQT